MIKTILEILLLYIFIAPEHPEKFVEVVEKLMAECQYLDPAEIDAAEFENEAEIADEEEFAKVIDY